MDKKDIIYIKETLEYLMDNTEVANHKDRTYITTFFNSIANSLQILNSALENINNEAEALPMLGVMHSLPVTQDDIDFMVGCNIHPHSFKSAKILTDNDEGAYMDTEDLIKLSDILYRYAKGNDA